MGSLSVRPLGTYSALESLAPAWDALAGDVPFRGPAWQLTWWKHYGEGRTRRGLFAWAVEDGERLVGLAPWYVERTAVGGNVVRTLASGEVCSEYLTVLAASGQEQVVAAALAEHLCETARTAWDRLDFEAAVVADPNLGALIDELVIRGADVEWRPGVNCWRIELPPTWDDYLAMLSKSHRKQLRRLVERSLDTPRARWHTTHHEGEFDRDWTHFVDLHQRRRRSLGQVGCFIDSTFAAFHADVAKQLLRQGRLRLHRLELDGRPIAAEYHLVGNQTIYAYQSGIDPGVLDEEPGRLAAIAVVRNAIAEGFLCYDLLRGDEPYKAHWRAVSTSTENVSIAAPRLSSRLRFALRRQARQVRTTLGKSS
jgi:CelD/BcsL family acetyltransferase involved in cellulose biosynthesis